MLVETCERCEGTGLVPDRRRSMGPCDPGTGPCPVCEESGVAPVECKNCGRDAIGREAGDAYCSEFCRAELAALSAPLMAQCPTCYGVGEGLRQVPTFSPSMSPRHEEYECDECDATGRVEVVCEICGDPAIGWEDGDPYCTEAHRAELEEQQRAILEDRLRASLEVTS